MKIFPSLGVAVRATIALLGITGVGIVAAANYTMTQGAGTTFGSLVVSAVNYAQQLVCDPATPTQCAVVDASGILTVKGTVTATPTGTQAISAASGTIASGALAAGSMVDLLAVTGTKNAGTAATSALLAGGVYNSTPLTLTNTQQSSIQFDVNGYLKTNVTNTNANGQAVAASSSPVVLASDKNVSATPYPIGATPYTNSATGTTSGAVATLAGASSVTTYLCGFSVRANATAATTVNIVVSGTISGSLNFTQWVAPLASGIGVSEMIFNPCIPASATNTSIVVTGGAPGSGGVNSAAAWGYKL